MGWEMNVTGYMVGSLISTEALTYVGAGGMTGIWFI